MQYPGAEIPITNQESALTGLISRQRPIIWVWAVTQTSDPNQVLQALSEGHPVISSQRAGLFTSGGHFIVLRGVTAGGKVLVNDPNDSSSKNYINREFDMMTEVHATANAYWIFAKK